MYPQRGSERSSWTWGPSLPGPRVHKSAWKRAATPLVLSLPVCRTGSLEQHLARPLGTVRAQVLRGPVVACPCLVDTQTSAQRIVEALGVPGDRRVWPGLMTEGCLQVAGGCSHHGVDKAVASRTPLWAHTGLVSGWLPSPEDGHCGPVPALLWLSREDRVLGFGCMRTELGFPTMAPPLLSCPLAPLPTSPCPQPLRGHVLWASVGSRHPPVLGQLGWMSGGKAGVCQGHRGPGVGAGGWSSSGSPCE